ncbi:MAG: HPr family phosphocarrier protein [Alphaproteobacteria bacterium]|nr:HPr family phosphocarrier protein [Alphaproteobacteria bacterium]
MLFRAKNITVYQADAKIVNAKGLHARAAADLAKMAEKLEAEFKVTKLPSMMQVDGRSILDLMMLAAPKGTVLRLEASGRDAKKLVKAAVKLVESGFNEKD